MTGLPAASKIRLDTLPIELLHAICDFLGQAEQHTLLCVSKTFYHWLGKRVWRTVKLAPNPLWVSGCKKFLYTGRHGGYGGEKRVKYEQGDVYRGFHRLSSLLLHAESVCQVSKFTRHLILCEPPHPNSHVTYKTELRELLDTFPNLDELTLYIGNFLSWTTDEFVLTPKGYRIQRPKLGRSPREPNSVKSKLYERIISEISDFRSALVGLCLVNLKYENITKLNLLQETEPSIRLFRDPMERRYRGYHPDYLALNPFPIIQIMEAFPNVQELTVMDWFCTIMFEWINNTKSFAMGPAPIDEFEFLHGNESEGRHPWSTDKTCHLWESLKSVTVVVVDRRWRANQRLRTKYAGDEHDQIEADLEDLDSEDEWPEGYAHHELESRGMVFPKDQSLVSGALWHTLRRFRGLKKIRVINGPWKSFNPTNPGQVGGRRTEVNMPSLVLLQRYMERLDWEVSLEPFNLDLWSFYTQLGIYVGNWYEDPEVPLARDLANTPSTWEDFSKGSKKDLQDAKWRHMKMARKFLNWLKTIGWSSFIEVTDPTDYDIRRTTQKKLPLSFRGYPYSKGMALAVRYLFEVASGWQKDNSKMNLSFDLSEFAPGRTYHEDIAVRMQTGGEKGIMHAELYDDFILKLIASEYYNQVGEVEILTQRLTESLKVFVPLQSKITQAWIGCQESSEGVYHHYSSFPWEMFHDVYPELVTLNLSSFQWFQDRANRKTRSVEIPPKKKTLKRKRKASKERGFPSRKKVQVGDEVEITDKGSTQVDSTQEQSPKEKSPEQETLEEGRPEEGTPIPDPEHWASSRRLFSEIFLRHKKLEALNIRGNYFEYNDNLDSHEGWLTDEEIGLIKYQDLYDRVLNAFEKPEELDPVTGKLRKCTVNIDWLKLWAVKRSELWWLRKDKTDFAVLGPLKTLHWRNKPTYIPVPDTELGVPRRDDPLYDYALPDVNDTNIQTWDEADMWVDTTTMEERLWKNIRNTEATGGTFDINELFYWSFVEDKRDMESFWEKKEIFAGWLDEHTTGPISKGQEGD